MCTSRSAPHDWRTPDWANAGRVHDWRNYASDWLRETWGGLSNEHKKALAATLDDIAAQ